MNNAIFNESLAHSVPPDELNVFLKSLWWEKKGNWQEAHNLVEHVQGVEAAWVHAYLHRVEGDVWNADYWYRRAGKHSTGQSLEEEWQNLVEYFINK